MTAIRQILQKEVFNPSEESLFSFVNVTKTGKKKKVSFLCAAVTKEKPVRVSVYNVSKKTDKDSYKKKSTWRLTDLKLVDGKDSSKDVTEFDLQFDKVYRWNASSVSTKNAFILSLWKLSERYLSDRKPAFVNISQIIEAEVLPTPESTQVQQQETTEGIYQELTRREEADLERMISQCEYAISNVETFTEQLSKDLSSLDGANITSIMGSEEQVTGLIDLIDSSLNELDCLDERLGKYDELLQTIQDQMEQMKIKDKRMMIEYTNHKKLQEEVKDIVTKLNVPEHLIKTLQEARDLSKPDTVIKSTEAAIAVQEALQAPLNVGLSQLSAVKEQKDKLNYLCQEFTGFLEAHIRSVYSRYGGDIETVVKHSNEFFLPKHLTVYKELTPFVELMKWLRGIDFQTYKSLQQEYVHCLSKLYEREIKDFFDIAKQRSQVKIGRLGLPHKSAGSQSSLNKEDVLSIAKYSPMLKPRLGDSFRKKEKKYSSQTSQENRSRSSSVSSADSAEQFLDGRGKFERVFDIVLSELEPVCSAEEEFVETFFHLACPYADSSPSDHSEASYATPPGSKLSTPSHSRTSTSTSSAESTDYSDGAFLSTGRKSDHGRRNEDVERIMAELFKVLEVELQSFIHFGDKLDSYNCMHMLVHIGRHVMATQSSQGTPVSFLSRQLANCLVIVKRLFDKCISTFRKQVEETKIQKKSRCGILPSVVKFEEFADKAEGIFKNADRRADLDKAYDKLIKAVFTNIESAAVEHQKTPYHVVMFENYHHIFGVLSRLKIACLDAERKEAKQNYQESMKAYVTAMLGRPMEKLNIFFDGVQDRLRSGVKPEEVGYQLAFSKQELRKVIKEYHGKEVKRGLELLYKKVEKHLFEEENLLQVVWHSMQEEFIGQYKNFDSLINTCYPGSMITLEFTIEQVLEFFSDIARSH